jgi:hypothetical protein
MNPTKWIAAKAKTLPRTCGACKGMINLGVEYRWYRERARSSHEAAHGGLYPIRVRCMSCTEKAITLYSEQVAS